MFTLAHLSDLHLGPLPKGAASRNFALKRSIGAINWRLNRHKVHDPAVAHAVIEDIKNKHPDHVALTGDIVNVAAHDEFPLAARFLGRLGAPDWVSFVPGNHDAYVRCPWEQGLGHLAEYMAGDYKVKQPQVTHQIATPFPYVRLRRNIALIGLASGTPQSLFKAGGTLGEGQRQALALLLRELKDRGYARVVMIHHPPLPGLATPRKALTDAAALAAILSGEGAELVLHGHNHEHMHNQLQTASGTAHVFGVPSASIGKPTHHPVAGWNLYQISRQNGRWQTLVTIRTWNGEHRHMETLREMALFS